VIVALETAATILIALPALLIARRRPGSTHGSWSTCSRNGFLATSCW